MIQKKLYDDEATTIEHQKKVASITIADRVRSRQIQNDPMDMSIPHISDEILMDDATSIHHQERLASPEPEIATSTEDVMMA